MLADFKPMVFLATTDTARARAFYESVLGLRFVSEDDFAVVYDIGGIEFRLQKVRQGRTLPAASAGRRRHLAVAFRRPDRLAQGSRWQSAIADRQAWRRQLYLNTAHINVTSDLHAAD